VGEVLVLPLEFLIFEVGHGEETTKRWVLAHEVLAKFLKAVLQ